MRKETSGFKRILAIVGLVLIGALIIAFLLVALFGGPEQKGLFMALGASVVAVPILLWLIIWSAGVITRKHTIASLDPLTSNRQHDKDGKLIPKGKINTVVFDIGNVLTDFAWRDFLFAKGCDESMVDRIAKATTESDDWVEYDKGDLTTEEIVDRFVENDPEIEDVLRRCFENIDGIIVKRDRTIPWIKSLQAAGYKVLYLSNFSSQALEGCPEAMAFIDETDGGILSYREHVVKPDPAIYNLLVERYNLTPQQTVFIDDTPVNIEAAKKLGWNGIVYKDYPQVQRELNELGVIY